MKRVSAALFLLLIALLAVPTAFADSPTPGREGRSELRFLEGMIDHHQMAIDMAMDCLAKASTDEVKTICQNVIDAQTAEIELMQQWLLDWYNTRYTPMSMMGGEGDSMGMMDMMHDMHGDKDDSKGEGDHSDHGDHAGGEEVYTDPAMTMGMFAGLNRLTGIDYDIAWLESMVDHHDDALHMSERLLARLGDSENHADLRALAEKIIADQTVEIETMEVLIAELG